MEHELRYYLKQIKDAMNREECDFDPQYLITATMMPNGTIKLDIIAHNIDEAIDNILDTFDDDMHLIADRNIIMQNLMVV